MIEAEQAASNERDHNWLGECEVGIERKSEKTEFAH